MIRVFLLFWLLSAVPASAECRQALALGLDVSGSVDAREYRLQMDGVAQALNSPDVLNSLLQLPSAPVQLLVYEWSAPGADALIIPWTPITSAVALDQVTETLRQTERRVTAPGTGIGAAMQRGVDYLNQTACWTRTLDISGDGKSNLGPLPNDVRRTLPKGITINALVIGADSPAIGDVRQVEIAELSSYFRSRVIHGPDAFVQVALGFEDYAAAMSQKLERELETLVIGAINPAPSPLQIQPQSNENRVRQTRQ